MSSDGLYANIETGFVRSHKFLSLPPGARCLYISLWCLALEQKRETIERPTDYYLASYAGLHHHPISSYLDRMHVLGLSIVDHKSITMVGLAKKHNKIKFKDKSTTVVDTFSPHLNITKQNKTKQNKTPIVPLPGDSGFDEFWKAYPRHINKAGALRKWNATLEANETDRDQLIIAAENYAKTVAGKDEKFILHPATFLGPDRRWKDYLDAPKAAKCDGGREDVDYNEAGRYRKEDDHAL